MGLQLHFKSELPSELYTRTDIPDVVVVLRRSNSEEVELTGPLSSIKVEMVVLDGEFIKEDWTEEEFNDNIVEGRKGRGPLLIGDTKIELKGGIGTFAGIKVTDNSHWTKCGFSLGVRFVQSCGVQGRIREARSKAIVVKDIRGKTSKKHASPSPEDEIWRLKNISKTGKYITELNGIGIKTVQELLRFSITDPGSLKKIGMAEKKLEETLTHARKCTIDTKYYIYSRREESSMLLLNSIYEVVGIKFSDFPSFQKLDDLRPSLKDKVEILKRKAYKNKEKIEEYNEELIFGPSKPQEVALNLETSTNTPNSQEITNPNELAGPSFNHFIDVPPQSQPMIVSLQPQGNGDYSAMHGNNSNVPTDNQQQVSVAGFIPDLQPSSPFPVIFSQYNTFGVTGSFNEPDVDHMNCWPANGSTATFNYASFMTEFMNLDSWPDSKDFTGLALKWVVLKVILWRMRTKKIVASKKTGKIE